MLDCQSKLCVLNRGVIVCGGAIKKKGSTWGGDFILATHLQYLRLCLALTYTEVLTLSVSDFNDVMASAYQQDRMLLRHNITWLKCTRIIIANARKEKSRMCKSLSSQKINYKRTILDMQNPPQKQSQAEEHCQPHV